MRRTVFYFATVIASMICRPGAAFGQIADTLYFDTKWEPCDSARAQYYRTWKLVDKNFYLVDDHYRTGIVQMSAYATSVMPLVMDGPARYYTPDGTLESSGEYVQGEKEGMWEENRELFGYGLVQGSGMYSKGSKSGAWEYWNAHGRLGIRESYRNGKKDGPYRRWHSNGKLAVTGDYKAGRRTGIWEEWFYTGELSSKSTPIGDSTPYTRTYYFKSGKVSARETYAPNSDTLTAATYWNADGSEQTDTTEIEKEPTFSRNGRSMTQIMQDSLHYPIIARRNNIEGRVVITMTILADGQAEDIVVNSTADTILSEEALRVARMFKTWEPGKTHNRYDDLYVSIPFVFRLN